MFDIANELGLNRRARSVEAAQAEIGSRVKVDSKIFECVEFNDLGYLYWRAPNGKLYAGSDLDNAKRI